MQSLINRSKFCCFQSICMTSQIQCLPHMITEMRSTRPRVVSSVRWYKGQEYELCLCRGLDLLSSPTWSHKHCWVWPTQQKFKKGNLHIQKKTAAYFLSIKSYLCSCSHLLGSNIPSIYTIYTITLALMWVILGKQLLVL